MREQPDNLQSYNVIGDIVQFLGTVHGSLSHSSILIMTEVFQTLTELCSVSTLAGGSENMLTCVYVRVGASSKGVCGQIFFLAPSAGQFT